MTDFSPWSRAWRAANTGAQGFYRFASAEDHFSTGVHTDSTIADWLVNFIQSTRSQPHASEEFAVIDIGAGDGRLLADVKSALGNEVTCIGVDLRPRPDGLHTDIAWIERAIDEWTEDITGRDGHWTGVVIAHEFLDDVPCDVAELDEDLQPRLVLVDPHTGAEEIGPALHDSATRALTPDPDRSADWLARWWPATRPLARREIGDSRDRIWSKVRRIIATGHAIAIDYEHRQTDRERGLWDAGTLKGFASGCPKRAVPDGSVNITAHVALDSCAGDSRQFRTQAQVLPQPSGLAGFEGALGSYGWLIERRVQR